MVLLGKSYSAISSRYVAVPILAAIACTSAWSQVGVDPLPEGPTILNRSPFIPPDWEPPSSGGPKSVPKKTSTGYEFRGVYQLGNEYRFLVSTPRTHNGKWVTIGTENDDYEVRGYDDKTETLTLFYDSKEEKIKLAKMDANPTPIAVSGQIRNANQEDAAERRPVRRTIRPTTRAMGNEANPGAAPPPPAWLQKLREEAAQRRAQAGGAPSEAVPPGMSATGTPQVATPPPSQPPPKLPEELLNIKIPPAPLDLPPDPPVDIQQQMLDSMTGKPGS